VVPTRSGAEAQAEAMHRRQRSSKGALARNSRCASRGSKTQEGIDRAAGVTPRGGSERTPDGRQNPEAGLALARFIVVALRCGEREQTVATYRQRQEGKSAATSSGLRPRRSTPRAAFVDDPPSEGNPLKGKSQECSGMKKARPL